MSLKFKDKRCGSARFGARENGPCRRGVSFRSELISCVQRTVFSVVNWGGPWCGLCRVFAAFQHNYSECSDLSCEVQRPVFYGNSLNSIELFEI